MPEQFWSLTVREFWLKFEAFSRAEDRRRSLIFEHALMVAPRTDKQRAQLQRGINSLRRYPIKQWLLHTPEA